MPFQLYAWVVMPEHIHLLILPVQMTTVTALLRRLKSPFAKRVIEQWRNVNAPILGRVTDAHGQTRFWQRGGGYDRNLFTDHELMEKIHYIHTNPVRRGLVDRPRDWGWSSARSYEGGPCRGPDVDKVCVS